MKETLTVGRTLLAAFAIVASAVASVIAQQPEARVPPSPSSTQVSIPLERTPFTSIERIRAALQAQQPTDNGARLFDPTKPETMFLDRLLEHPVIFRLGVLTFVTPSAGLFIDIRLPIGDIVTHAARSVGAAQHRRAEDAAHAEVVKALAVFQNTQPK